MSLDPSPLFPVFLRLHGKRVVLVGAGPVAASKLGPLLDSGADVTIVAPEISADVEQVVAQRSRRSDRLDQSHRADGSDRPDRPDRAGDAAGAPAGPEAPGPSPVTIERRPFVESDLDGVWFVVAAAPPEVNREVGRIAGERSLFVNAVDDKDAATAYLGGVVRKGGVTVAVGTDGAAPALAGLLREALEAVLPEELSKWSDVAREARADWKRQGVPMAGRRPLLLRALNLLYDQRARTSASSAPPGTST